MVVEPEARIHWVELTCFMVDERPGPWLSRACPTLKWDTELVELVVKKIECCRMASSGVMLDSVGWLYLCSAVRVLHT